MPDNPAPTRFSLRRWSQRKIEASRGIPSHEAAKEAVSAVDPKREASSDSAVQPDARAPASSAAQSGAAAQSTRTLPGPSQAAAPSSPETALPELPPIDSLTIDSDFSPFMRKSVDDPLRRSALKKLFQDPRFNIMDGLDVYIDDYSKPDPIDPAVVRTLVQARYIFNPPATRVNEQGFVEDVPDEPSTEMREEQRATDDVPQVEQTVSGGAATSDATVSTGDANAAAPAAADEVPSVQSLAIAAAPSVEPDRS